MPSEVTEWLRDLGLGDYAGIFEENGVDVELLPELDNEDLKDLGVSRLADRKKLLKAIAELRPDVSGEPIAPADRTMEVAAERRQLTVMFVDLVGSTTLSGRLDPEDYREVLRAYQDACAGVVARYEGHVAKLLGDGSLIYFGYPQAHEDDAERAVRAGLDVVRAVSALEARAGEPLRVRVGIATGLVVVGDMVGEGVTEAGAISGETPNLAARLQALAQPDTVVIAESTHRLLGGVFESADLGQHALKGIAEPVRVRRVVQERAAASRFEAVRAGRLTPFVGREQEIALLLERWAQAKQGEGQVVQLSSEAGIGKSRMIGMLLQRVSAEPRVRLRYQCSPHHVNSALYPFIVQLERAAGFAPADGPDVKLDKLEALLRQGVEDISTAAPLVGELLSIPTGTRYAPLNLEPQRRKQLTLAALLDQLAGLAAGKPVLVAFEDAHWADPTSLELLEAIVDRIQGIRVIAMITHRPEFRVPWAGRAHVTSLALKPLTRRQSEEMIAKLTDGKPLPEPVLEQIVDKTDGMPLFIEELTKEVLQWDLLADAGDKYELHGPLPPFAIPSTLQDSLMAKLDRLAPVKEVAQTGAAIGREFSHALLAAVSPLSEAKLAQALERLTEFELLFRRGVAPEATYVFKHALVQDAAYESLLKSKRQELHGRIAQALERSFPETVETEPELLAHHYTAAELSDQAITYWQKAGERALRRSANVEAINHLNRGLELLKTLPESRKRDERELPLQLTLGPALMAAKGQGASDMRQAYARARVLGLHLGDTREHFRALWGLWRSHFVLSEFDTAQEFGEQCLNVAETSEDVAFGVVARFALGGTLMFKGDIAGARVHLERAIPLYDIEKHRSLGFVYGQDPGPSNLAYLSFTLWYSGFAEQAIETGREAVLLAKSSNHPLTVAMVQMYLAMSYVLCRDWYAARSQAEIAMELANAHGFPQILSLASTMHGRALVEAGDIERGIPQTEQGIAKRKAIDVRVARPFELMLLAEGYGAANRIDEGLSVIAEALEFADRTGEGFNLPEIHRLKGELLLQQETAMGLADAERCFHRAIEISHRQQAKPLELRAATSLARLWRDQGKTDEARDLLAPVHGWFTEGFDTSDLKEAEALLDELS